MTRKIIKSAAALLVLTVTACTADTSTEPSESAALTEAHIAGEAPAATSQSLAASQDANSAAIEGTLEVEARVYVQNDTGEWVLVTDGTATQTVDASASGGFKMLGRSELEAGIYERVRIEFERVEGEVAGGFALELGGAGAHVSLGTGARAPLVVERQIAMEARAGAVSRLEIVLNVHEWAESAATTGLITNAALDGAVSVSVQ